MKRLILIIIVVCVVAGMSMLIKRSIPYSDRPDLYSAEISIDSIWTLGPAAAIYDKTSKKYYWLKSYTSLDQRQLDTLKSKKASIRYAKFLMGPLANRIFRMEVDSIVIVDQVVERE
jgi:hypothetical protein